MADFAQGNIVLSTVVDYKIQTNATLATLQTNVLGDLTNGQFLLFGPPFHDGTLYCQALVKFETKRAGR